MNNFQMIAELWRAKRACGTPWVSKYTHPRQFGNHVTVHHRHARPSAPQGNQCSISHFLASLGAQEDWYCIYIVHQCCDQLTAVKTGYLLTSTTDPSRSSIFLKLSADKLLVFKWSQAQVLCLCAAQLKFWLQTDLGRENSASCLQAGKTVAFDFWRSTSNFYALIGQNLTGDAASWILFTLTSEADRVLCQLLMF